VTSPGLAGWDAVSALIAAEDRSMASGRDQLKNLLSCSRQSLAPFHDPLEVPLAGHRWLRLDREEAYSDWLEWVLAELREPGALLSVLGVTFAEQQDPVMRPVIIKREPQIKYGHENHEGRLDLLIQFGASALVVVEVKVTPADASDTDKHTGYCRWLLEERRDIPDSMKETVLITPAATKEEYSGFVHVGWSDVCVRLRNLVPEIIADGRTLSAALILCFIAAVEQNLLGLASIPPGREDTLVGPDLMRMVLHLSRACQNAPAEGS